MPELPLAWPKFADRQDLLRLDEDGLFVRD